MKLIIASLAFTLLALVASAGGTMGHSARVYFESSDGIWAGSAADAGIQQFQYTLWQFEAYKLMEKRPDVTLVRITPDPKEKKDTVLWHVPFHAASGHSNDKLISIGNFTREQADEISRRADADFEYWKAK